MYFPLKPTLLLQDEATDDEIEDADLQDPACLKEDSSPGEILHINTLDADRLAGALLNDYNRKLVKVNNFSHKFSSMSIICCLTPCS